MRLPQPSLARRAWITAAIVAVLGGQALRSFRASDAWYPFISYPMYSGAHFEGERLDVRHVVYAVTDDGGRHEIDAGKDLRVDFWRFERKFVKALAAGDSEAVRDQVGAISARYPRLARLEVEDYPAVLTRDGTRPAPRSVIAVVPVGQREASKP